MAGGDVQKVQAILERWRRGDYTVRRHEFADEFIVERPEPGAPTVYGLDGLAQAWHEAVEPWASWEFEVEDLIGARGDVVALLHVTALERGSGRWVHLYGAQVWTFRNGRVIRIAWYEDTRRAMRAAALAV